MEPILPPTIDPSEKLLPPPRPSGNGPLIGAVIVILLLIFGALYFWGAYLNKKHPQPSAQQTTYTRV